MTAARSPPDYRGFRLVPVAPAGWRAEAGPKLRLASSLPSLLTCSTFHRLSTVRAAVDAVLAGQPVILLPP